MHSSVVSAAGAAGDISQARVRVQQCCFYFERCLIVHPVAVNDMSHVEACQANVSNALQLVARIVVVDLVPYVRKDTITNSFPNIEGFTVPRVDEPIDISLQFLGDVRRKLGGRHLEAFSVKEAGLCEA
jgi:hypothetical protein